MFHFLFFFVNQAHYFGLPNFRIRGRKDGSIKRKLGRGKKTKNAVIAEDFFTGMSTLKNFVKAGIAKKCEVQLSYAIGFPAPTSIHVNTFGTSKFSDEQIGVCLGYHY